MKSGDIIIPYMVFDGDYISILQDVSCLTRSEKRLLMVLNAFAYKDGGCYPCQFTIAKTMGLKKYGGSGKAMSTRQIRRITNVLVDKGFLSVDKPSLLNRRLKRGCCTNKYFFIYNNEHFHLLDFSIKEVIDFINYLPKKSRNIDKYGLLFKLYFTFIDIHTSQLDENSLKKTDQWFAHYGYWIILANRFLPGTRSVISFFSGVHELDIKKTFIFALISAFLWNILIIYLGMTLGNNVDLIDYYLTTYSNIVLAVTVIIVIIVLLRLYLTRKNNA